MITEEQYIDGVLVKNISMEESDLSTQEQKDTWILVCNNCELNNNGACQNCGCLVLTIMTYSNSSCPIDKW